MEYLKLVTGMYITHIPYRGTGPQLTDLLAGRTQASSAGLPALGAHIRAGKLRAIAVGTQQRISGLPDVPTVAELGFKDFETSQWYGILVPAGTPPEVVKKIQEESLQGPQVQRRDRALRHRQRRRRRRAVGRLRGLHQARAGDLERHRQARRHQGGLRFCVESASPARGRLGKAVSGETVDVDVLVIGGGNAALCAALMAREAGASVMLLEAAPREWRGGNSMHTRNLRCMHDAPQDVLVEPTPKKSTGRTCSRSPAA